MHAAPVWLLMAAAVAAAVAIWFAVFNPKRRLSLWSLLVLLTLLAVAFAVGRWKAPGTIEVERAASQVSSSWRSHFKWLLTKATPLPSFSLFSSSATITFLAR